MVWKTEKWKQDIFPGTERVYEEYRLLPARELVIVGTAVLDSALAELISMRLLDHSTEYEAFLGLNEDGRAPCATFGARIQLAVLLGIISPQDAAILRTLKKMRNKMAHKVKIDFTSKEMVALSVELSDGLLATQNGIVVEGLLSGKKRAQAKISREILAKTPQAGEGVFLAVLAVYQAYFHLLHIEIPRITPFYGRFQARAKRKSKPAGRKRKDT